MTGLVPGPAYRVACRGSAYSICTGSRLWPALRQLLCRRHAVRQDPLPTLPRRRGRVFRFTLPRLRRRVGRGILGWQRAASTLSIVLVAGACGMPAQFGFSGPDNRTDSSSVDLISALSTGALTGADLAVASAATTTLLDYRDGGPWENPDTGARGTITPLATAYRDGGIECHD